MSTNGGDQFDHLHNLVLKSRTKNDFILSLVSFGILLVFPDYRFLDEEGGTGIYSDKFLPPWKNSPK